MDYQFNVKNPDFASVGYILAVANVNDKHDRSAPSDYHWKILKCRMLIFSHSSILASPDRQEVKKVHIVFNKIGNDYDKLTSLFLKFSLTQDGNIKLPTLEIYKMCFRYTLTARIAPVWNVIGYDYLVNNREFLETKEPQEGIKYNIGINDSHTIIYAKPVKINLVSSDKDFLPGEIVRVLPSLCKATVEDCWDYLPSSGLFKSYKDLRRHWKNIHGYRLPEDAESAYISVSFWRGHSYTYPKKCLLRSYPIITPLPKHKEKEVLMRFLNCLRSKMPRIIDIPLSITAAYNVEQGNLNETLNDTQAVSLCTQTQAPFDHAHIQAKRRKL